MTFEEIYIDEIGIPQRTASYTMLMDYCTSEYWQEEVERFKPKRKSIELSGENAELAVEKVSSKQEVLGDVWVDNTQDRKQQQQALGSEIEDLEQAYKSMSKMTAEYMLMERAAATYTSTRYFHNGTIPVMRPCGTVVHNSNSFDGYYQGAGKTLPVGSSYSQYVPLRPVVFKENTLICREWLQEHYESKSGVSIPRSAMYSHYLDYCNDTCNEPLNPAGFGKALRSLFINIQTRRLGNRGASKYHYYGLSIKENSPYKSIVRGTQRVNSMMDLDSPGRYNLASFHPRTMNQCTEGLGMGAVLEGFPSLNCILVAQELRVQLNVFLPMYKSHCDNVLDIVLHTNFSDVKECIVHFWENLPGHLYNTMKEDNIASIIQLCDVALYKSIGGMLLPNINQSQPKALLSSMRQFTENLVEWTILAVSGLPPQLGTAKLTAVKDFHRQMDRQSILSHMIQGVKTTFRDSDIMKRMLSDWMEIDQMQVSREIVHSMSTSGEDDAKTLYYVRKCMRDFELLLSHHAAVDKYFGFINNMLHQCTSTHMVDPDLSLEEAVSQFMLHWASTINIILREFTISAVQSFGSYHLLGMLLTDYLMYLVEERQRALNEVKLKDVVYRGFREANKAGSGMQIGKTEYKPIFPKTMSDTSTLNSMYGSADNKSYGSGITSLPIKSEPKANDDSQLRSIMTQLSTMNKVDNQLENRHLYLATPVTITGSFPDECQNISHSIDPSGNAVVTLNDLVSHITDGVIKEEVSTEKGSSSTISDNLIKEKGSFTRIIQQNTQGRIPISGVAKSSWINSNKVGFPQMASKIVSVKNNDCGDAQNLGSLSSLLNAPKLVFLRSDMLPENSTKQSILVSSMSRNDSAKTNNGNYIKTQAKTQLLGSTHLSNVASNKADSKIKIVSFNQLRNKTNVNTNSAHPITTAPLDNSRYVDSIQAYESLKRCLKSTQSKKVDCNKEFDRQKSEALYRCGLDSSGNFCAVKNSDCNENTSLCQPTSLNNNNNHIKHQETSCKFIGNTTDDISKSSSVLGDNIMHVDSVNNNKMAANVETGESVSVDNERQQQVFNSTGDDVKESLSLTFLDAMDLDLNLPEFGDSCEAFDSIMEEEFVSNVVY